MPPLAVSVVAGDPPVSPHCHEQLTLPLPAHWKQHPLDASCKPFCAKLVQILCFCFLQVSPKAAMVTLIVNLSNFLLSLIWHIELHFAAKFENRSSKHSRNGHEQAGSAPKALWPQKWHHPRVS